MNEANFEGLSRSQQTATDSLLAIPTALLTSSELLIALTAEAARDDLADCATALSALSGVASPTGVLGIYSDLSGPMLDKALNHGRTLLDIITQTQLVVGRLMVDACRMPELEDLYVPIASPWPAIVAGHIQTSPSKKSHSDQPKAVAARRSA
jgi:hypothetical protein